MQKVHNICVGLSYNYDGKYTCLPCRKNGFKQDLAIKEIQESKNEEIEVLKNEIERLKKLNETVLKENAKLSEHNKNLSEEKESLKKKLDNIKQFL